MEKKKGHRLHTRLHGDNETRQVLPCRPPGRGEYGEGQTSRTEPAIQCGTALREREEHHSAELGVIGDDFGLEPSR
jgi:hypothetical protein